MSVRASRLILGGTTVLYGLVAIVPLAVVASAALQCSVPVVDRHVELRFAATATSTLALLGESVLLALVTTAVAVVIGIPLALLLASCDLPGRRAIGVLHCFPLFLPPFLLALGWFHLLGDAAGWLFGAAGVVLVLAGALTPIVTALVSLALVQVSSRAIEAARLCARPGRVALRILLPQATSSAALAGILVFAFAFSELGVPMFLGVRAYPAVVFTRLAGLDYAPGEAAILALPMLAAGLLLLLAERSTRRLQVPGTLRWQREPSLLSLGRMRWPAAALVASLVGTTLAPIAALASRARGIATDELASALPSLLVGLGSAAVAASAIVGIALVAGHAIGRQERGATLLDAFLALGFLTPAALLGIGLIETWNRPAFAAVYATPAILVIGYVARYAVIGARSVAVAVAQTSPSGEEAAAVAGAGFVRRLLHIVAGQQRSALLGAWLLGFVFCLRDLETAVLYYPAGSEPLTVRIFTLEANGPDAVVAALASLQIAVTGAILAVALWLLSRSVRPRHE